MFSSVLCTSRGTCADGQCTTFGGFMPRARASHQLKLQSPERDHLFDLFRTARSTLHSALQSSIACSCDLFSESSHLSCADMDLLAPRPHEPRACSPLIFSLP